MLWSENRGKWKGRQSLGVEPRSPLHGLSHQWSATEPRLLDNHQLSQSSVCTSMVHMLTTSKFLYLDTAMSSTNQCDAKLPSDYSIQWNFSIPDTFGLPKECPDKKCFVLQCHLLHLACYVLHESVRCEINGIQWNSSIPLTFGPTKKWPNKKNSYFSACFILCVWGVLEYRGIIISGGWIRKISLYIGESVDCM